MAYEVYLKKVREFTQAVGGMLTMSFIDDDTGKYVSVCRDGTRITGNSISGALTVMWGSGHQSVVRV